MAAALEAVRSQVRDAIGSIRDPDTGAFPTVVMRGDSIDELSVEIEGSPELIALVKERLDDESDDQTDMINDKPPSFNVFLSYASEDFDLAKSIAEHLTKNGIETWWDNWSISAGDSLRQKIDEGIQECTHFVVLLTPNSIGKPWVNQEIDAGLVRKLNENCRLLPIRYNLPASQLTPILASMHAPEIDMSEGIDQLIADIYGVNRKPPLGSPPQSLAKAQDVRTGYSPAATIIAQFFVENSKFGNFADPMIDVAPLAEAVGLSQDDTKDALYELRAFFKEATRHVLVNASLFSVFDEYWKPWRPADDARRLASDIHNDDDFPANSSEIAARYEWEDRRLNPAIAYLYERDLLVDRRVIGTPNFVMPSVIGKPDEIRRFVKG